jgi:arylsulfatase A-like enzyme
MNEKKNVIVIMADQMRATASHLWGNPDCITPNLERLAERGVLFENAFTPHPLCVPARVSLWSSQYSHAHGSRRNETYMAPNVVHGYKLWKQTGYVTGLIGKNHCFWEQSDLSLFDVWCEITHVGFQGTFGNRGMEWFRPVRSIEAAHGTRKNMPEVNPVFRYAFTDYPLEDYSTGLITGQSVRFLRESQDKPFALWISYPDPHSPYEVPRQYADKFDPDAVTIPRWGEYDMQKAPEVNQILKQMMDIEQYSTEEIKGFLIAYYAMINFIDDGVGQIMDTLKELGLLDETIVVFCADHGDFAGEHGMVSKGGVFYDSLTHVPLIFYSPELYNRRTQATGKREDSMVNLIDILPTILRLQGIDIPFHFQGTPLPGITDSTPRQYTFSEYGAGGPPFTLKDANRLEPAHGKQALLKTLQWREAERRRKMIRSKQWKLVYDPWDGTQELYNLEQDPSEVHNLAHEAEYREIVFHLMNELLKWSIETEGGPRKTELPVKRKYDIDLFSSTLD